MEGTRRTLAALCIGAAVVLSGGPLRAEPVGVFEDQSDVGSVVPPGTGAYDATNDTYTITSSGENLWYRKDAFHFLWKKMSGDMSLTADIDFPPPAYAHPPTDHRKALLMIRQTLDEDGVYADAALHGSGLAALQYRREKGANTQDIEQNIPAPKTLRLIKRGDEIVMLISMHGETLHRIGATIKLHFDGPFYVGLGLTSHDVTTTDKVVFSHVKLETPAPEPPATVLVSTLQVIQTEDQFRRAEVIVNRPGLFESPNWAADGKSLLINEKGKFTKIPLLDPHAGGTPEPFDIGAATGCWGEHGFSPDGKWLAISCSTPDHKGPDVYVAPAAGGAERQVTHQPVSFFRGWSPDSKTIAFVSILKGHRDVYTIPIDGGPAAKLTNSGENDGAEFTPDGKYIYFNSDASGSMQIWRMSSDGSAKEQVTHDALNNWYPHISPDGKQMVFLTYDKGVVGHPENKDVALRLMDMASGEVRVLVNLTGGQGTIDSPSWSTNNNHLAFVSYEMVPASEVATP